MRGERRIVRVGFSWHVFAYFPCNTSGVRIAVRKTPEGARRVALAFARRNQVETSWGLR